VDRFSENVRRVLLLSSPNLTGLRELGSPFAAEMLGWSDLRRAVARAAPSSVVVLDPFTDDGERLDQRALEVIAACRMVPTIAIVPFRVEAFVNVRTLLRGGLTEIADAEMESTPEAIRLRLLSVHAQPFKRRLEAELSRFTSANARTLLRGAAEVSVDGGGALELARRFDAQERTVAGWCRREVLPAPRRLLAWTRVLLVLLLLEEPERSLVGAARAAGYATDYTFRRAMRELLGDGGARERSFAEAMASFNGELRDLREKARRRARGSRAA
jgi:AraC-like DNA-binding protein